MASAVVQARPTSESSTERVSVSRVRLLSVLFMGLAHLTVLRQRTKGLLFAAVELTFLLALPVTIGKIVDLVTLGDPAPNLPVKMRPNSLFMLIDGITVLAVVGVFVALYWVSIASARRTACEINLSGFPASGQQRGIADDLTNRAFPVVGLAPTFVLIVFFVVVPLVFSALVAFTNYSSPSNIPPAATIDWVGLDNFRTMFGGNAAWTGALVRVFAWTIVWAFLATGTCYIGGMVMAVVLQNSRLRITPLFRAVFILPYAIPGVVSLLVWRNLLNGAFGTVNRTLQALHIISDPIPWLSDPWLAKFVVVLINLWCGFPYFMLLVTGTMTSISADIIEAAKIDGASSWQIFRRIQAPIILYQTMPLIIMSFAANINNFGAIFFLTGGDPTVSDSVTTGAGGTDIMVSWIYKLTVNLQQYQNASVLAIMIFLIIAPFAIYNFQRTKSYKEGDL
ncbi:sugar ABC transporter permease [Actinomyces sp. MRS3W]|uniref:carbohydrate ABC transporter permease n=1 Tax=Actinomyces sp. MRS3W TaxID=2800796 RepID=UPI0028FD497C|nr:sugar ABC transporter permease [Actinomyces sp. MRS3W]MDU0348035.1 sugar ABC transporter permease [Actinomyces sp. MRS3W]